MNSITSGIRMVRLLILLRYFDFDLKHPMQWNNWARSNLDFSVCRLCDRGGKSFRTLKLSNECGRVIQLNIRTCLFLHKSVLLTVYINMENCFQSRSNAIVCLAHVITLICIGCKIHCQRAITERYGLELFRRFTIFAFRDRREACSMNSKPKCIQCFERMSYNSRRCDTYRL